MKTLSDEWFESSARALVSDQWMEKGSGQVLVNELKLGPGNYPVYCDECHHLITLNDKGVRLSWPDGRFFKKLHESCAVFDQEVLL